jgi:hypothetical protein
MTPRSGACDQIGFEVRFDWGLAGAKLLAAVSQVLVVVDVLSFSTAVEVALARGATVVPGSCGHERPAAEPGAILAVGRSQTTCTDARAPPTPRPPPASRGSWTLPSSSQTARRDGNWSPKATSRTSGSPPNSTGCILSGRQHLPDQRPPHRQAGRPPGRAALL